MITIEEIALGESQIIVAEHNYFISTLNKPISKSLSQILSSLGHAVAIPEKDSTLFYYLDFKRLNEIDNYKTHELINLCSDEDELINLKARSIKIRSYTDCFVSLIEANGEENLNKFFSNIYLGSLDDKRFITDLSEPLISLLYYDAISIEEHYKILKNQLDIIRLTNNKHLNLNWGGTYEKILDLS